MAWALLTIFIVAGAIIAFLKMPYSATKAHFQNDISFHTKRLGQKDTRITEQDIKELPGPVQAHIRTCGYLGKRRMSAVKAYITSAPLRDSNHKPPMLVDYTLCSFSGEPVRLAYIKTSMFGIPFEGYDSTQGGVGFMKGVLGKVITLFHQRGAEMDKAQLLTYLGECLLIPSSILEGGYITWEAIDGTHAKGTISYKGITGSGIFTFDEEGFVQSFQTDQRARIGNDGRADYPVWSLVYGGFQEKDGIFYSTTLKTMWHDSKDDLVYFDAKNIEFVYDENEQIGEKHHG